MSVALSPPEPLRDDHQTEDFDSGEAALDDRLTRRARANQAGGASRTYVVCEGKRVVGYYALASGAIAQATAPGKFRRNMPEPIPVVVLARMAVDRSLQGRGLGRAMFRDGLRRLPTPLAFGGLLSTPSPRRRESCISRWDSTRALSKR